MLRSLLQTSLFGKLGVASATPSFLASSVLAENSAINVNGAISVGSLFFELFLYLYNLFISVVYFVCKLIWNILDVVQLLINKMAGIGSTENAISFDNPIFDFLLNKKVLQVFEALFIVAIILFILFTLIAIGKMAYQNARGGSHENTGYIMRRAFKAAGLLVFVPIILLVFIVLVNSIAASLNNVFKTSNVYTTFGGEMFAAASYDANRYRQYADNNMRIPILINFDDPLDGGDADDYSAEQLAEIYNSFTKGHIIYNSFADMDFPTFNQTLYYNNKTGELYNNASTYSGYESFICTREQYYVMADFIDYAVRANLSFTIKNAADHDIDWAEVSNAVYDEESHALTIRYKTASGEDSTIVYETNYLEPTTPMQDAISIISQILGLTEDDATHNFTILDRLQEGGLNNVEWQKDTALLQVVENDDGTFTVANGTYNEDGSIDSGEEYTVSLLTKREYWASIGGFNVTGEFAVVALGSATNRKYVLVEKNLEYMSDGFDAVYALPTNDEGEEIVTFLTKGSNDLLEEMFVRVTWPEKLLQDISVIYEDINIQELILSGKWGEALGEIEKIIDQNASTSGAVASFSTSVIHPFGLILSELFMGDLYFPEPYESAASIGFSSSYDDVTVRALLLTILGEDNYFSLRTQLEYYMELFNNMMTPVLDDIASAEGFDMTDGDEQSVILYTYKAYLASLLLGQDFSDYFADFAVESLMSSVLLQYLNDLTAIPTTAMPDMFVEIFQNVFNDGYNKDNQPFSLQVLYSFLQFVNTKTNGVIGDLANNANFVNVGPSVPSWLLNYAQQNWENVLLVEKLSGNAAALFIQNNLSNIVRVIESTISTYIEQENGTYKLTGNYEITRIVEDLAELASNYNVTLNVETYKNLENTIINAILAQNGVRIEEVNNTVVRQLDALLSVISELKEVTKNDKEWQSTLTSYYTQVSTFKTNMISFATAQTQQYQLVRYYISASVSIYLSERQTSGITVILNGKSYNVSLNTMSAKMVEYILGNTPNGVKAVNQVRNGVSFENLDYFAKTMMYTLQSNTLSLYNQALDTDSNKGAYKKLYDDITNYIEKGNTTSVDLNAIADALDAFYKDWVYTETTDDDNNTIYTYEFMFIEDDFEGLLNANGECFTLLKEFLYEFGNVCFDLMYKTNLKDVAYSSIDTSNTVTGFYSAFANFLYNSMCEQSSTTFVNENITLYFDAVNSSLLDEKRAEENISNMLAYLGLTFDASYALKDYRSQALLALTDFQNRAGESATSYSMRYLTLFYIATSQATIQTNETNRYVTFIDSSRNTRAMMMRLAGMENRPEAELVGLDYSSDVMDVIVNSEEKGAVYIICTYDEETLRYKPFLMTGDASSGNFPYSAYISTTDTSVLAYPVIAKGVMTEDGLPTAIREIGGNISFYRKNIVVVNASEVGLSTYFQSYESVSVHYGFIGGIINNVYKLFTGKTITQQLMESVPRIKIDYNINLPFGTRTQEVAVLSQGSATLNYNFDVQSGIAMPLLYSPIDLNPIVLISATIFLFIVIFKILFGLIKRIFNVTVLFLVSPPIISTIMLDVEGYDEKNKKHTTTSYAFDDWKKSLIENILMIIGVVLTLNIYFMILPMINDIELFTPDSFTAITNIGLFKNISLQAVNGLAKIVFMLVAVTLISTGPKLLGKIFGIGDAASEGETVIFEVSNMAKEVQYYASGRQLADTLLLAKDTMDNSLIGKGIQKVQNVHNKVKDARDGKSVYNDVLSRTGDADLAQRSANALMQARVNQRNAEREGHASRVRAAQARKEAYAKLNEKKGK